MEDEAPYCPSLDESIVPLNYVSTYVIEVDKETREEVDRLDHLNLKDKLRRVWETQNEEEDMKDIFNLDMLWDKPSKRKSWADAERLRKIGNTKYAKGLLMEALCLYNDALCFLPLDMKDPSKDIFPLIVANRSLVLYEIGSYKPALQDIKLAQDSGYPQNLLYKLQVRQAACFWALGKVVLAKKCFERSEESASTHIENKENVKKALDYIKVEKKEVTESKYEKLTSKQTEAINCVTSTIPNLHKQG
jgi:tetratricopeptide (TPR) repeat protein